jgi:N-glycosylase/DNA lyase
MIRKITDDFNLEKIAESGQCFRWKKILHQDNITYRIISQDHCIYVSDLGGQEFDFSCSKSNFDSYWTNYFDLELNYAAIRSRIDPDMDPFLFSAASFEQGIRILRQDPWEMLITFIISQNKNIPAIKKSVELLCETCGEKKTDPMKLPYYAFPSPEAVANLSEKQLKACKLGYRWKYIRSAAEDVLSGQIDLHTLPDTDEAATIQSLTNIYGVGIKVANCVSLFGLHHINAFPIDVWVQRILDEHYPDGYPYDRYHPYNGIYQQYLFAYYRMLHTNPATNHASDPKKSV